MPGATRAILGNVLMGQAIYLPSVTYPTLAANASNTNTVLVPGVLQGDLLFWNTQAPPAHIFLENAYVSAPGVITLSWTTDSTGISTGSVPILMKVSRPENSSLGIATLPNQVQQMWPTAYAPLFSNTSAGIEQSAPLVVSASTTSSAASQLPGNPQGDSTNLDIHIENTTNGWAFCNFGDAQVPAATLNNGIGVPPGLAYTVRVQPSTAYVTVILNTGATSGSVRFQRGSGIT